MGLKTLILNTKNLSDIELKVDVLGKKFPESFEITEDILYLLSFNCILEKKIYELEKTSINIGQLAFAYDIEI